MTPYFLTFYVPMQPIGKARPRVVSKFGHMHAFTPKKTKDAEDKIKNAAIKAMAEAKCETTDLPLCLSVAAFFALPKSATKKRYHEVASNHYTPHTQKPDIDNVVKLVADALNKVVYFDDKQIAQIKGEKYWTVDEPYLNIVIIEMAKE